MSLYKRREWRQYVIARTLRLAWKMLKLCTGDLFPIFDGHIVLLIPVKIYVPSGNRMGASDAVRSGRACDKKHR
jgi:hypothetical protein